MATAVDARRNRATAKGTHEKVVKRCEKQQTRMYFTDVLMPALDGTLPASETVTASSVSD